MTQSSVAAVTQLWAFGPLFKPLSLSDLEDAQSILILKKRIPYFQSRLWRQLTGRKDGLILLPGEIKLTVKTVVILLPIHCPQKSPDFFTVVIWCLWLAPTFTRLLSRQAELSLRLGSGEWLWEQFPSKTSNSICFPLLSLQVPTMAPTRAASVPPLGVWQQVMGYCELLLQRGGFMCCYWA